MPLLCVGLAAVPHPAAFTVCQWIAVRPVQKSAEIVPLVKATHVNAITHAHRDALGQLEIVRDQQCLSLAYSDNETLVTRLVIVGQQAPDEARDFDPPPVIAFREANASSPLPAPS